MIEKAKSESIKRKLEDNTRNPHLLLKALRKLCPMGKSRDKQTIILTMHPKMNIPIEDKKQMTLIYGLLLLHQKLLVTIITPLMLIFPAWSPFFEINKPSFTESISVHLLKTCWCTMLTPYQLKLLLDLITLTSHCWN